MRGFGTSGNTLFLQKSPPTAPGQALPDIPWFFPGAGRHNWALPSTPAHPCCFSHAIGCPVLSACLSSSHCCQAKHGIPHFRQSQGTGLGGMWYHIQAASYLICPCHPGWAAGVPNPAVSCQHSQHRLEECRAGTSRPSHCIPKTHLEGCSHHCPNTYLAATSLCQRESPCVTAPCPGQGGKCLPCGEPGPSHPTALSISTSGASSSSQEPQGKAESWHRTWLELQMPKGHGQVGTSKSGHGSRTCPVG